MVCQHQTQWKTFQTKEERRREKKNIWWSWCRTARAQTTGFGENMHLFIVGFFHLTAVQLCCDGIWPNDDLVPCIWPHWGEMANFLGSERPHLFGNTCWLLSTTTINVLFLVYLRRNKYNIETKWIFLDKWSSKIKFHNWQSMNATEGSQWSQANDKIHQSDESHFISTEFLTATEGGSNKQDDKLDNGDSWSKNCHLKNIRSKQDIALSDW